MTREEIDALEAMARGAISVPEAEVIVRDVPRLCALARECLAWRAWYDDLEVFGLVGETIPGETVIELANDETLREALRLRRENEATGKDVTP